MISFDEVRAAVEALQLRPTASGKSTKAFCPCCSGRTRSLNLTRGDDGKALLHCHRCNADFPVIVAALGLSNGNGNGEAKRSRKPMPPEVKAAVARAFPDPALEQGRGILGNPVAIYDYRDEEGELRSQTVRFHPPSGDPKKTFRQCRPDGNGGWMWNLEGVDLVLYNLQAVLQAPEDATIYVVEGEKDADALTALGCIATTNPMGAGKWRPEYAEALRDAHVVIVQDRDEPGRKHAQDVYRSVADVAASVRIVEAKTGKDVSDHLDAAYGLDELVAVAGVEEGSGSMVPNNLPEIPITVHVRDVVDAGEEALIAHDPHGIFQRCGALVRIVRDRAESVPWLTRVPGTPLATQIGQSALTEALADAAVWTSKTKTGKTKQVIPRGWIASTLTQRGEWKFPVLESIVSGPVMLPDGSILEVPGYDARTGIFYEPAIEFEPVPDQPSFGDAAKAWVRLLDPLHGFCVVDAADLSVIVTAEMTILARPAIAGPVPMFGFLAPVPGAGKGLAADVVSIIGTGRAVAKMAAPKEDDEMRKRLLSIALEGDAVCCFDNVTGTFGSPSLAMALTAGEVKDRILGENRTVQAPLRTVMLMTGNGVQFRNDLGRRVIPCHLDPKVEHPEDRTGFRYPKLLEHVREHRAELVRDVLTILRAFHVAGRPGHGKSAKGSFEAWDALIRGAVVWVGAPDPLETVERIRRQGDSDLDTLRNALHAWHAAFGTEPKTAAEAVKRAGQDDELRAALAGLAHCPEARLDASRLGWALRSSRDRIADGLAFAVVGATRGVALWAAVPQEVRG